MNQLLSKLIDSFGIYKKNKLKSPDSQFATSIPSASDSSPISTESIEDRVPEMVFSKLTADDSYEVGAFRFRSRIQGNGESNDFCSGEYYRSTADCKTDVVIVHGWKSSSLKSVKKMLLEPLMAKGYNLYFMELPYHLSRKPPESGFSGEYMISANVQRTIISVQQAVVDAADLVSWSKANSHQTIVIGASLGGLVTNFLGCVCTQIDALVSVMYASNLAQLIWHSAVAKHIKHDFVNNEFSLDELDKVWSVINPSLLKPKVSKDKILLMTGKHDLFITKEDSDALCKAWGNPKRVILSCGHSGLNVCGKAISDDICRFIDTAI